MGRDQVWGLLVGVVFLVVSVSIFYLDFVEGMWEGTEFDWLGLISAVFAFVLAVWVIQDSLKTDRSGHKSKGNPNDAPAQHFVQ